MKTWMLGIMIVAIGICMLTAHAKTTVFYGVDTFEPYWYFYWIGVAAIIGGLIITFLSMSWLEDAETKEDGK